MNAIAECMTSTLEHYVGRMAADTCLRATAISLGKTTDDLDRADLPTLDASIRRLLEPVAPRAAIDRIIDEFNGGCA